MLKCICWNVTLILSLGIFRFLKFFVFLLVSVCWSQKPLLAQAHHDHQLWGSFLINQTAAKKKGVIYTKLTPKSIIFYRKYFWWFSMANLSPLRTSAEKQPVKTSGTLWSCIWSNCYTSKSVIAIKAIDKRGSQKATPALPCVCLRAHCGRAHC